jgi:hypothetical protein
MDSSLACLKAANQGMVLFGQTVDSFFVGQKLIGEFVRRPPLTFFVLRGEMSGDLSA